MQEDEIDQDIRLFLQTATPANEPAPPPGGLLPPHPLDRRAAYFLCGRAAEQGPEATGQGWRCVGMLQRVWEGRSDPGKKCGTTARDVATFLQTWLDVRRMD